MMRKAFTLIELLVVIAIIAVLVTILVPVVMTGLGKSESTVCQNNLGVIGRKHNDYANEAETYVKPFPRHIDVGDPNDNTALTPDDIIANIGVCGMQTVWVMIDRGDLTDTAFKCPGDSDWTSRTVIEKYGWEVLTEFSYGIHYPYTNNGAAIDNEADPNAREKTVAARLVYRENLVLFADRNPGGAVDQATPREHSNHAGSDGGCIVVSRVGNTKFFQEQWKSTAGFGDDVYTDSAIDNAGAPAGVPNDIPDNITDTMITPKISRLP